MKNAERMHTFLTIFMNLERDFTPKDYLSAMHFTLKHVYGTSYLFFIISFLCHEFLLVNTRVLVRAELTAVKIYKSFLV